MSSSTSVVTINAVNLPVLNYRDQRVITTEYLAQLYGTEVVRIRQNHARNPDRFDPDKHFFKVEGDELSSLKILSSQLDQHTASLILWTERGAARHAKMLDTDQAWAVFDQLEKAYFEGVTPHAPSSSQPLDAALLAQQLADLLKGKVLVDHATLNQLTRLTHALEGSVLPRQPISHGAYKKQPLAERLLDFITAEKGKGAGHRTLQQFCKPYRNATDQEREAVLNLLLDQGVIFQVQPPSKPGARRKAVVYVARQFVKEMA